MRAHAQWLAYVRRTSNHINAPSIVRSPDYSYDAVASSYNTRFCCATNAPGRKTYRSIHYISLHNGRLLAPRFNTYVLSYEHFFHANIRKTACEFRHSHDILVASDCTTIVTGPLVKHHLHCFQFGTSNDMVTLFGKPSQNFLPSHTIFIRTMYINKPQLAETVIQRWSSLIIAPKLRQLITGCH